jgi:septal ring factor EnvC (AmiA/AmiB activator)
MSQNESTVEVSKETLEELLSQLNSLKEEVRRLKESSKTPSTLTQERPPKPVLYTAVSALQEREQKQVEQLSISIDRTIDLLLQEFKVHPPKRY